MRRNLLNNLAVIFTSIAFVSSPLFAAQPAFLVYHEGVDLPSETIRLEVAGAKVRQSIPPRILVVDLPSSMKAGSIPGTSAVYTSAIALSSLEPLGPVAVAAGMTWNRNALRGAAVSGQGFGAMRTLVAQRSLPPTSAPLLTQSANTAISAAWQAIDGAITYEVEAALDPAFRETYLTTRNNLPQAELALPEGAGMKTVYVRVRGIDSIETENGEREDVNGAWSKTASIDVTATPASTVLASPSLSSPNADFVSAGFTLILEWIGGVSPQTRVQVSKSAAFQSPLYDTVVTGGEYVVPSPSLKVGDTLYWRVRSWGAQKSAWSQPRSLRIGSPRHEHIDMFVNPEAPK